MTRCDAKPVILSIACAEAARARVPHPIHVPKRARHAGAQHRCVVTKTEETTAKKRSIFEAPFFFLLPFETTAKERHYY